MTYRFHSKYIAIISLLLAACQTVDFGASSYMGQSPLQLRHIQTSASTYYIESRGNGFSNYEMLTTFFLQRAKELCNGDPKTVNIKQGQTVPNGKLPDIRIASCYTGGFCQGDQAAFPLIFGEVECTKRFQIN